MPLRNLAVLPIKLWRPDERRKIEEQNYATVEERFEYIIEFRMVEKKARVSKTEKFEFRLENF